MTPALARLPVSPNTFTFLGFLSSMGAAALLAVGSFPWGGGLVLLAGVFDLLDGAVARARQKATAFGAFLDSVLDRLSEMALFLGLLAFYLREGEKMGAFLSALAMAFCFLVSYFRARGEGLGVKAEVGIFTRPERVVILSLGLFLNRAAIALGVISVLSLVTIAQRWYYIWRETRR